MTGAAGFPLRRLPLQQALHLLGDLIHLRQCLVDLFDRGFLFKTCRGDRGDHPCYLPDIRDDFARRPGQCNADRAIDEMPHLRRRAECDSGPSTETMNPR